MSVARPRSLGSKMPRRLLIGFGSILIASAVAVGSGANFNSTSANPGTLITGGTIVVTDSLAGQAVLGVNGIKPGGSVSGTVNIKNGGNIPASFQVAIQNLVDIPASPPFSAKLSLEVDDLGDPSCVSSCPAPVALYIGPLASMGALGLGTFSAGVTHEYRFTVTFPDGGPNGADDAYGGASTKADFLWTATQS
jgi:spore coat-associated protein N